MTSRCVIAKSFLYTAAEQPDGLEKCFKSLLFQEKCKHMENSALAPRAGLGSMAAFTSKEKDYIEPKYFATHSFFC